MANANINLGDDYVSECNSCPSSEKCSKDKQSCMIENNSKNNVGKIIGVMSGKGGVGKSSISVLIAKHLNSLGYRVGVLDADITGPSIPRLMNLKGTKCIAVDNMMIPAKTIEGIKVMSLNLMIKNENDPVIWRGPMIAGAVKQFWTDTLWEELDYLIIDMPPGTGDVALTVMQTIPLNGIVMVSVPQDFVSMIVSKAINMARKMNINILGVIENMSYIVCPDCGKKIKLFNGEGTDKFLEEMDLKLLGKLPVMTTISGLAEYGYENANESLELIFNPIVKNIIDELGE